MVGYPVHSDVTPSYTKRQMMSYFQIKYCAFFVKFVAKIKFNIQLVGEHFFWNRLMLNRPNYTFIWDKKVAAHCIEANFTFEVKKQLHVTPHASK